MSINEEIKRITPEEVTVFDKEHEELSKKRVVAFQKRLDSMTDTDPGTTVLRDYMELQTKIEEFIVKSREAEHPKWKAYATTAISIIAAAISALSAYIAYRHR